MPFFDKWWLEIYQSYESLEFSQWVFNNFDLLHYHFGLSGQNTFTAIKNFI